MINTSKYLKLLWKDTCSIVERQKITKANKSTGFEEITVLENESCKLSFSSLNSTNQADEGANLIQITKLFLSNEIDVKPGSKIIINRQDKEFVYKNSGLPGIFTHHQEIVLKPFEGWA